MPKILILNYHVELPIVSEIPKRYPNHLGRACTRAMWYADSGDIIVSPVELDDDFFEYVARAGGIDLDSVTVTVRGEKLYDDVLLDKGLVTLLQGRVAGDASWTLMPCNMTEGVAELARLLGIDAGIEMQFAAERGADLLNRKSHFRQLAVGSGLPLAPGAIVRSPEGLFRAVTNLLAVTGTVVVKQDNAAGGAGNIAFTSGPLNPLPGAAETRPVPDDLAAMAVLWEELTEAQDPVLVVESFHHTVNAFFFEYFIGKGGQVTLLSNPEFKRRLSHTDGEPVWAWIGLEIPADAPAATLADALTRGAWFAAAVAAMGYRGYMNIDAIVTDDGRLIFNEINARWSGGLVLHTIATRLLGHRYADNHVISSVRNVKPAPFTATLDALRARGLGFNAETREGIVVVAHGPEDTDNTECLIIAESRQRVRELESLVNEELEVNEALAESERAVSVY
ncbi:peptide ligase PGM1-related protein [Streptomyces mirabilis]|uniref:Peptide ligase PGM1-related protein n=1 Tax=Streptomyces mirabilis TaxID=68239 RepID=A0ABU3V664_9ACTN|nr:peptide ligase PGM1-related protein [Streptomyces mirabilis]MCX5357051.1 peptide ligase PGM1-related protein [Streptomyces mirabilis]MDU9001588.1 peptide ligase PGM1-related protein [Streptomyces mirabilis]